MNVDEITIEEEFIQFINDYPDDPYCLLELLRFWERYPTGRFSQLAIIHALESRKPYVDRALRYLINKRLLRGYTENNVPIYSLTDDKPLRRMVLNSVKLNWH